MPTFVCRVGAPDGSVVTRSYDGSDETAVRAEVARVGGRLFSIQAAAKAPAAARAIPRAASLFRAARARISADDFVVFNQELVALLRAGLPIVSGFDILIERQENPRFKEILADVKRQLVSGVSLSDAFLAHGDVFPKLYATSLKAGERSGEVPGVLKRYLEYQKTLASVRRKVTGAIVYPAVLVGLSIALVVVLMTYVIPKFTEFYGTFGGDLPLLTRVVVGVATFLKLHVLEMGLGLVAAIWLLRRWARTDGGARALDGLALKLPLLGTILHQFALSQFTRALGTLVASGTPLVPSLEISSGSIGNRRVAEAVTAVVPKVREGAELWKSLEETGQFTSLSVEMIKVGEATGALEEMLRNVSEFYDDTIAASLQKLLNLIEPVILIVMGIVISLILLSVYLPMFSILSNLKT